MYTPECYEIEELNQLVKLIAEYPLGSIVTFRNGVFDANHVPFLAFLESDNALILRAHVSRENRLWSEATPKENVLVLFRGAQGYISPNWYPGKARNENQTPTWNYQVANIHGELTIRDDEKFVRGVVARLTNHNESSQPKPWKMTDSDSTFITSELKKVVGIEVNVGRIEGKFKLSQNRSQEDWMGAIEGTSLSGNTSLSLAMRAEHGRKDNQKAT